MAETNVYLFWRKDRPTGCREVLFSGDTITTSLHWDASRKHFSSTDTIATGIHSGMLLGDDFDAVTVEAFQVVPSATCLFIEIRTEVLSQPHYTTSASADNISQTEKCPLNFTPPCSDTIQVSDRQLSISDDYYDHLIEEDHYKTPRDCLRDGIYQIPSSLPVPLKSVSASLTPLPVPPTNTKSPLFNHRHPRNYSNAGMQDTKTSAPLSNSKNSAPTAGQPMAAPRPKKVREGLDIAEDIPSHYDTCKARNTVKKQVSECGTCATQSAPITSPLLSENLPPTPTPLRPHRHLIPSRPLTSGPFLNNDKAPKECSSPVSDGKILSPLAVTHRAPGEDIVPLAPGEPDIGVKSGTDVNTQSEACEVLKLEIFDLNKQLIDLKIEHSQVLGGEIVVRQRLEQEVLSCRQECERLKAHLGKVTKELETNSTLLKEERKSADNIKCEIIELKKRISDNQAKPKIIRPKPILPKLIKKV